MVVELDILLEGDTQDILQLVDTLLTLVIPLHLVDTPLHLGDTPLYLEAILLLQATLLLVAIPLPPVEGIRHLQVLSQGLFLGIHMVSLPLLEVMVHSHMVNLLLVVMERHLTLVVMGLHLMLVVMVLHLPLAGMEGHLLQVVMGHHHLEDTEGILRLVDMGHNHPLVGMECTLGMVHSSLHSRVMAHKLL